MKLRPIVIICGIDPINENRVDMEIEPQSRVEALDKRDRTSLRLALGAEFAGPLDERRKIVLVKMPSTSVTRLAS